jgi:hypothetical protein
VANRGGSMIYLFSQFVLVLVVAAGLFALQRLVGWMILVRTFGRQRRTARLSHMGTALFLVVSGLSFLRSISWIAHLISG